jgi:hypothetical protein
LLKSHLHGKVLPDTHCASRNPMARTHNTKSRKHHNPIRLPCTFSGCNRWFRNQSGLTTHWRAVHIHQPAPQLRIPPASPEPPHPPIHHHRCNISLPPSSPPLPPPTPPAPFDPVWDTHTPGADSPISPRPLYLSPQSPPPSPIPPNPDLYLGANDIESPHHGMSAANNGHEIPDSPLSACRIHSPVINRRPPPPAPNTIYHPYINGMQSYFRCKDYLILTSFG